MLLTPEDKIAIQELSSKYANAMDEFDIDAWLATWSEGGIWEGGAGRFEGKESLRGLLPKLGDRIRGKRHVMTNFVIRGDERQARQTCYLLIVDRAKGGPPGTAVYNDVLEKVQGQWLFLRRNVVLDQVPATT